MAWAEENLWGVQKRGVIPRETKQNYCDYFLARVDNDCTQRAAGIILQSGVEYCASVHGDFTLENIIVQRDGSFQLIDPGEPHGMCCRELDEGKLLQSVYMQWERRGWQSQTLTLPNWASKLSVAFLASHWARLTPHWPGLDTASGWAAIMGALK